MSRPGESVPLLWRVERERVVGHQAPAASLVSVAHLDHKWFVVARGDIPAVVGRPFDPELDVPVGRLDVSLQVGNGVMRQTSSSSTADRSSWSALLQWEGADSEPLLRVTLELDGASREYLLSPVE